MAEEQKELTKEEKLELTYQTIRTGMTNLDVGIVNCFMVSVPIEIVDTIEKELKAFKTVYYLVYRYEDETHNTADVFVFRYKHQANVIRAIIRLSKEETNISNMLKSYLVCKLLGYADATIEAILEPTFDDTKEEFKILEMSPEEQEEYAKKLAEKMAKE